MVLQHIQMSITCNGCIGCSRYKLVWKREKMMIFSVSSDFYITPNGNNTSTSVVSQKAIYSDLPKITKLPFLFTFTVNTVFSIYNKTD